MSDSQEPDGPNSVTEVGELAPPLRLTPSPDATESESKLSRKREREVSVEPVTTPAASHDADTSPNERNSSSRIPVKKNRRRLDPTEEEAEDGSGSGSGSPPTTSTAMALASPRQEMKIKVRQISRGVEDINWKSVDAIPADHDLDVEIDYEVIQEPEESQSINEDKDGINEDKGSNDGMVDDEDTSPKTPEHSGLPHSVEHFGEEDTTMVPATPEVARLRAENNEKGLKRKFLERGTSHGPPDSADANSSVPVSEEPLKRPRDDADKDDNPRETKRPTPPPSPPLEAPPSPKIPKMSGFMAYASTNSPFSAVKGQNIFGSKSTPSPPPFPKAVLSPGPVLGSAFVSSSSSTKQSAFEVHPPSSSPFSAAAVSPATTAATIPKLSGFEAFASSSSPFAIAAARAKSPLGSTSKLGRAKSPAYRSGSASNSNPFASYAGPSHGFALPAHKRARAGSPDGSSRSSLERPPSASVFGETGSGNVSGSGDEEDHDEVAPTTFGERLRAGRDDEDEKSDEENPKMMLTEQDVMTGEEEEETIHQVRGKLFSLHDNQWKERGTGLLKLNVKVDDGTGARLVMRKDAVYTLLLNITLFPGMKCSLAQDPRYIRFSAIEGDHATTYNLKVPNAKIAADLLEEINANIPT